MTNGDKYRRMTDEELVDALFAGGMITPPGRKCATECRWDSCRECWIAYLGEEAENETPPSVEPNCISCHFLTDQVIDEFPVSKCPFHGEIKHPWTTCCDEYARGGAA